jgi:hypothetical protein
LPITPLLLLLLARLMPPGGEAIALGTLLGMGDAAELLGMGDGIELARK